LKEPDDGHTTLVWDHAADAMVGPAIPAAGEIRFALSLPNYALECRDASGEMLDTFPLQGATHEDLVKWFQRMLSQHGADPDRYRFDFHYDLPCHADRSHFPAPDADELARLAALRSTAHKALELTLASHTDTEPVRIWPHHFDSGALLTLERKSDGTPVSTVGMGLAVPDAIVPEHYFYVSPWRKEGTSKVSTLAELTFGRWVSDGFNGAVLEATNVDLTKAARFLQLASRSLEEQLIL
jgi:hypothetical protein